MDWSSRPGLELTTLEAVSDQWRYALVVVKPEMMMMSVILRSFVNRASCYCIVWLTDRPTDRPTCNRSPSVMLNVETCCNVLSQNVGTVIDWWTVVFAVLQSGNTTSLKSWRQWNLNQRPRQSSCGWSGGCCNLPTDTCTYTGSAVLSCHVACHWQNQHDPGHLNCCST